MTELTTAILTILLGIIFIISFKRDKRNLLNAFLFLALLGMIYILVVQIAYQRYPRIHEALLTFLYFVVPLIVFLVGLYLMINGLIVLKKEGKSLSNSLSLLLGLSIVIYSIIAFIVISDPEPVKSKVLNFSFQFFSFFFILFSFLFLAFFLYTLLYLALPRRKDYDYIIIHGSGLINGNEVSALLRSRIDKAILAFKLAEKRNVKFIASGGQGSDESISEALAIKNYLKDKGFKDHQILVEDQSISTWQNLKYSHELALQEKRNPKFLFVSNNYHVFRTIMYARQLKIQGEGLGSTTAGYYVPSAFIREFIAILKKLKYVILILFIIFMLLAYISYM